MKTFIEPNLETIQRSINKKMDKQFVLYSYRRTLPRSMKRKALINTTKMNFKSIVLNQRRDTQN
jgi:hypothetical protein